MKCFYHKVDLDGQCSGAIVKMACPECEMVGITYGDEFPWRTIGYKERVYMVDFSLQPFSDMLLLDKKCTLVWIDHHKTALGEYLTQPAYINGACGKPGQESVQKRMGLGACAAVWSWFHASREVMPDAVRLLAEYDMWDHSDPNTLPFQYGIKQYNTSPVNTDVWKAVFYNKHILKRVIREGVSLVDYENKSNAKYAAACAFETSFMGMPCIAVNKMLTNSMLFDSVWDKEKYSMMIAFGWMRGKFVVSLYTTRSDVDVSEIAKSFGGGGHAKAAGFQCDKLPFLLVGKTAEKEEAE